MGTVWWDDLALRDLSATRESEEMEAEYQAYVAPPVPQPAIIEMPDWSENLIQNGDLEELDANGAPVGFTPYKASWGDIVSRVNDPENGSCVRIKDTQSLSPWFRYEVAVVAGAKYQVVVDFKSDPKTTEGAIKIEYYDDEGKNVKSANSQRFGTTNGKWEKRGTAFDIPQNSGVTRVSLYFRMYQTGELYYDNLQLYMVQKPNYVIFEGDTFLYTEWETSTIGVRVNDMLQVPAENDLFDIALVDGETVLKEECGIPAMSEHDFEVPVSALTEKGKE